MEDCISELPCDILIHIRSFLTLKDSAMTSILSKSWRNLWSNGNRLRLDFDAEKMLIKEEHILPESRDLPYRNRDMFVDLPGLQRKFVERVNNELRSCHKAKVIDEFRVRFEVDEAFENDIDNWLEFVFARKVQNLELDMLIDDHTFACNLYAYGFPNKIVDQISNESSKESPPLPPDHLTAQNNRILGLHDFDSLRSLSLSCVLVSNEVISFFLKKCRNLERVKLCNSNNLMNLEVCGTFPALKYLEICHCSHSKNIIVRDTNLVSLKLNRLSILENNPKLVEVCLASDPSPFFGSILPLLVSGSLSRVQVLTLDVSVFNATEVARQVIGVPRLLQLKQLTLNTKQGRVWIPKDFMLLSTSLISLSPILEKFVLQSVRSSTLGMEDRQLAKGPKLPLQYLKSVEFRGYYGYEAEDELIMFFVENAVCLETIIIDPCGLEPHPRLRDLSKEKESLKRANKLKEKIPSSIKFTTKEFTMREYPAW